MNAPARPDPHGYAERWTEVADHIAQHTAPSSRIIAFLHAAKTGGSSTSFSIESSGRWWYSRMKESYVPLATCNCNDPACTQWASWTLKPPVTGTPDSVPHYFCHFVHERYCAIRWFRDALAQRGVRLDAAYSVFRPARERLVSMFCDYWVQAMDARQAPAGSQIKQRHRASIRERYRIDSEQYVDRHGRIDAIAWFRSYAQHGVGMPFTMGQMFDGSVTSLRLALQSGDLTLLRMRDIDPWLRDLTGCSHVQRRRTSADKRPAAVVTALEEARDIIDALAETDWTYDQAADEHLRMATPELGRP
jgi:hypothetical protein